jgi:hypothetical protein
MCFGIEGFASLGVQINVHSRPAASARSGLAAPSLPQAQTLPVVSPKRLLRGSGR